VENLLVIVMALTVLAWVAWPLIKGLKGEESLCPSCGKPYKPGDKFCSHCGQKLQKEVKR